MYNVDLEKAREISEHRFQNRSNFEAALILDEVEGLLDYEVSDVKLQEILEIGLEVYYAFDYSTPTGVGMGVATTFVAIENQKEFDKLVNNSEELKKAMFRNYENSEWR